MDDAFGDVVILDAGSQYGKRIDRRVRELNVKSDLRPLNAKAEYLKEAKYKAIIISGGPGSVLDDSAPPFDEAIFKLGVPVLGICYGKQLMVKCCGGQIARKTGREDGQCDAEVDTSCPLFKGINKKVKVLLTHGDGMNELPPGFKPIARHDETVIGVANLDSKLYGLQFHPEVDLTDNGFEMIKNFVYDVAAIKPSFTMGCRQTSCIAHIRSVVGEKKVLMLLSGGIDSTVSALLLLKALKKEQVHAVFVNNGFMRKDESKQVVENLNKLGLNVKLVQASNKFYTATTSLPDKENRVDRRRVTRALCEVTDPEEKRHIIGDTFVEVAKEVMKELELIPENTFLGQGTLRPDLIESASLLASSAADVIKTHHNDSEMVRQWRELGRVVEPLTDFHKDEVRALGKELGLSEEFCQRHPFPGPGLAIRVICAREPYMGKDFAETQVLIKVICSFAKAKNTDHALTHRVETATSEREREKLMKYSKEHFTGTLLPIRTVGVQGDGRSYSYCAALSSPSDEEVDWEAATFLARIIPKVCHNVNRVAYVFGGLIVHPVAEITQTWLTPLVLSLAREADHVAHQVLTSRGLYGSVAQMPVVVIPVQFDRDPLTAGRVPSCGRSIVMRPFLSKDFMTGRPSIPGVDLPVAVVNEMAKAVRAVPGVSRVLYDLTPKPPGTTEWE